MEEILNDLIINRDHTGLHYVPVSSRTMEKVGSKRVEITGLYYKRQLTAVFVGIPSFEFLPSQIIYKGKIKKCLPNVNFPTVWHVTFMHNHWANEETAIDYINLILLPYVQKKLEKLKNTAAPVLVIFYHFHGQCTQTLRDLLGENNI